MRSFCVECGEEGLVYQGLCAECLPKKRSFVTVPDVLELARCTHCGAYDLPGGWRHVPLEEALPTLLTAAATASREVRSHHLTVDQRFQDPHVLRATYRARLELPEMAVTETGAAEVRLKQATCPSCSRQRGEYYEAILQIRAQDRPLAKAEARVVQEVVGDRVRRAEDAFVTKVEEVHGGLDLYLSSGEVARGLARDLADRLGGRASSSPRLHTRKAGKDVYRVTHLVRLPAFARGDVLGVQGRPHRVLRLGNPVLARDLTTGRVRRFDPRSLADAQPVDARVAEGVLVYQEDDEVQVLDTETQEVVRVRRPPALELTGDRVTLIRAEGRTYLGPPEEGGASALK